jgi:4-deoxy-L-threo-5-hexosulose-uronate ketol-isomerase
MLTLQITDLNRTVVWEVSGKDIETVYRAAYREGDRIKVRMTEGKFLRLQLDPCLKESIIYLPGGDFEFEIPFGSIREGGYGKEAFEGEEHPIRLSIPSDEEIYTYGNLALNAHARHTATPKYYPHATANFVTREDPCFFERNAIDGICDNTGHGPFPYHSWAGGAREDLTYTIDFGTPVEVDKIVFFLRADFPHDTFWKSIDVGFSDGSVEQASLEGTAEGQVLTFPAKTTQTIHLHHFKQISYPLSWAALSQIEVYGTYLKEETKPMETRQASNSKDVRNYTTQRLREEFHIANLFTKDNIRMVYSHFDRIITAGLMPVFQVLKLEGGKELASEYFLQRREMGCINVGGKGTITVDGIPYEMNPRDGIFIGLGNKEITFESADPENPAKFYVSSCPAHTSHPICKIDITKAKKVPMGSVESCNKRVINQYIHPEVMPSCQLAMGLTELENGSNWNTMPCHTHDRRMEVYMYLDMGPDDAVFHMMGEPKETRHILMRNEEAVISPSWSIHSGVGTRAYSFIWSMCGENQEFTDMDFVETKELL